MNCKSYRNYNLSIFFQTYSWEQKIFYLSAQRESSSLIHWLTFTTKRTSKRNTEHLLRGTKLGKHPLTSINCTVAGAAWFGDLYLYYLTWQNNPAFWVSVALLESQGQAEVNPPAAIIKKQFVYSVKFNLDPLKEGLSQSKVLFWGSCRGHEGEAADAPKRVTTVSNFLKCLYGASAVNKTSGCLSWMTLLFLFKAGKRSAQIRVLPQPRRPWPRAQIPSPFGPEWGKTHAEVHRWTSSQCQRFSTSLPRDTFHSTTYSQILNFNKTESRKIKVHSLSWKEVSFLPSNKKNWSCEFWDRSSVRIM